MAERLVTAAGRRTRDSVHGETSSSPAKGLDAQGYIEREGSLGRVPRAFRPVVAAARDRLLDVFGARLHSAYLYGSIPRGTARVGRSDLDLLVALREEPTEADRDGRPGARRGARQGVRADRRGRHAAVRPGTAAERAGDVRPGLVRRLSVHAAAR